MRVAMEIHTLEALSDNYMYLIVDASTRAGAVVDPADPDVVMEAVQRLGVNLTHVLALLTRAFPGPPYCTYVRTYRLPAYRLLRPLLPHALCVPVSTTGAEDHSPHARQSCYSHG